jgi:hypothetical protein
MSKNDEKHELDQFIDWAWPEDMPLWLAIVLALLVAWVLR